MHIPDGLLSPAVAATTGVVAAAGMGFALKKLERGLGERTTVLMGIMAAFVFAAQMVNFPVGVGVSGHLMGGVLAAVMLGPWAGAVVLGAVLIVQCFLFADGGLTALGANFLNMGLVGSAGGYAIYLPLRGWLKGRKGVLIAGMLAAWFSVILASGAFAVELAASGWSSSFVLVLSSMVLVHSAIGLGEALITGLVLRFVLIVRPDLVSGLEQGEAAAADARPWRRTQAVVCGLGIALAVAIFLAPFASQAPDGLEFVGAKLDFLRGEAAPGLIPAPIPDYSMPGLERYLGLATAGAGAVGTLVVFGVALVLARAFGRQADGEVEGSGAGSGSGSPAMAERA